MLLHFFYVNKMPLLNYLLVDKNNINKILKYDKLCFPTDKNGVLKNSKVVQISRLNPQVSVYLPYLTAPDVSAAAHGCGSSVNSLL